MFISAINDKPPIFEKNQFKHHLNKKSKSHERSSINFFATHQRVDLD
jgi:hypothetical protein